MLSGGVDKFILDSLNQVHLLSAHEGFFVQAGGDFVQHMGFSKKGRGTFQIQRVPILNYLELIPKMLFLQLYTSIKSCSFIIWGEYGRVGEGLIVIVFSGFFQSDLFFIYLF